MMQIKTVDYNINIASYDDSSKKDKAVSFTYQHQIDSKHTDLQTNLEKSKALKQHNQIKNRHFLQLASALNH